MNRVEGLEQAVKDINEAIAGVKEKSQAAFWEVGLKILNKAMRNLRGSVVTGNLRASGYARPADGRAVRPEPTGLIPGQNEPIPGDRVGDVGVEVGFTAVYALNVHENLQAAPTKPGNHITPKFLEQPVMQNKDRIVKIIKSRTGGK
jgi:hypothetical protein